MEVKKSDKKSKPRKRVALGRGLSALIPDTAPMEKKSSSYFHCNIKDIIPNKFQPRRVFDEIELEKLSDSIQEKGVLQPVLVRKIDVGYELIAGERRYRAASMCKLEYIPAIIKDISDQEMLEISIIENIQREDFNPIEEADAYNKLMTDFNLTQEQVSQKIGKSRSAVANFLRLRNLPDQIKDSIADNRISMGHARALIGIENSELQRKTWEKVLSEGLSVRDTESLVKNLKTRMDEPETEKEPPTSQDIYFSDLAGNLSLSLGTKVQIKKKGKKGRLEIDFYNDEDLDRLINILKG